MRSSSRRHQPTSPSARRSRTLRICSLRGPAAPWSRHQCQRPPVADFLAVFKLVAAGRCLRPSLPLAVFANLLPRRAQRILMARGVGWARWWRAEGLGGVLLAPPLVDPEPRGRMGAWATPKATRGRRSAVGGGAWARGDGGGVRQCREQRACVRAAPEVASGEWEARAQAASRAASCECARPFCAAFILPQLPPSSSPSHRPSPPIAAAVLPPINAAVFLPACLPPSRARLQHGCSAKPRQWRRPWRAHFQQMIQVTTINMDHPIADSELQIVECA
uniref:Uncharacterized protein n=1 Tax=Oryza rufipogon TaxID=4529 RepID=A0A0E0PCN2_ORYRU